MTTTTAPGGPRVDDAVYTLALHLYVLDRAARGEQVDVGTAQRIARIAGLRGLNPTTDVVWLRFELHGSVIHPLDPETIHANEEVVRQHPQGALHLQWLCGVIRTHSVSALAALLA